MQYRQDKYGNPISVLGFGCMRFTQTAGKIDIAKAEQEIMEAFQAGVNYYDTAYVYPGSEAALGEILARNRIRDRVNIATKLPHYLIKKPDSILAKETISSMQAGLVYGYIGQTEYIVKKIKEEAGLSNVKVVATGGLGKIIADETDSIDIYDKDLTLNGLRLIYEKQKNS